MCVSCNFAALRVHDALPSLPLMLWLVQGEGLWAGLVHSATCIVHLGFSPAVPQTHWQLAMDVGIAVLMNIRPWSESPASSEEWLHYLRAECSSAVASQAIEDAILQLGDGQYAEWVFHAPAWTQHCAPRGQERKLGALCA